jgi:signal transduction histidine kinase
MALTHSAGETFMLHSLRLRLLLTMVAVVAVTAGTVALVARQLTVAEFQRYLSLENERSQRLGTLFSAAGELGSQDQPAQQAAVERMSSTAGLRVIIADEGGTITADSSGAAVGAAVASIDERDSIVVMQRGDDWATFKHVQSAPVAQATELRLPVFAGDVVAAPVLDRAFVGAERLGGSEQRRDVMVIYAQPVDTAAMPAGPALRLTSAPFTVSLSGPAGPDPIQSGFVRGVNQSLALALVVAGVAALLLTAALSRRIIRPVEELTLAAEAMATGDLSRRVVVRAPDEIGTLGRAFNTMADSLQRVEGLRRTMVGDVAHELRTPLTNIRGYLEALRDGVAKPNPRMIDSLHEEALLLNRLIDDLQDLALAEAGQLRLHREPADLGAVIEGALSAARPRMEVKEVELAQCVDPELPPMVVDAERVGQVLRNLLNNALTHTPAGGVITVTASAVSDDAVRVSVCDTGCGIAPEELPLVFERFYRSDRSRNRATGGAGLGLTIVRQLVEAHGGSVEVTSEPGEGSCFSFTLPVGPATGAASAARLAELRLPAVEARGRAAVQ